MVPSQRFEMDTAADPIDVYRMLRVTNPSPYMYLLNVPNDGWRACLLDRRIAARRPWSPSVTARRPRIRSQAPAGAGATEEEDVLLEKELLADEKERAEHLMLVDLGRNDLGPGLRAGHGARRGLQPHRALQPRHASGLDRHGASRRGQDRAGRGHRLLPGGHAVRCAEGAGDGAHRGGREDASRPLRRRPRLSRLRGQRRLRDRHPDRADARRHGVRAGRRRRRRRLQRPVRVQRGAEQGAGGAQRDRRRGDAGRSQRRSRRTPVSRRRDPRRAAPAGARPRWRCGWRRG